MGLKYDTDAILSYNCIGFLQTLLKTDADIKTGE